MARGQAISNIGTLRDLGTERDAEAGAAMRGRGSQRRGGRGGGAAAAAAVDAVGLRRG